MKHLLNLIKIIIIIAILLPSNILLSQDNEFENYAFDDNDKQKLPYFALSFGINANFLFMNYDEINKKSSIIHTDPLHFSGPVIGWGFDFFSAMSPLVNNARVGISYFSGSQAKELTETISLMNTSVDINHHRKLSVSNVGIHFDYAFVPIKSLAILPGLGVKLGTMTLEQYRTQLPVDWSGVYSSNGEKLEYSYIALEPQISVEYAITGFLMVRGAGYYVLPFDNPFYSNVWTTNGNNSYSGVPKSVKPQGFSASIGLYLGLFNY